ncbi:MAG TPA: quinoprotein dehydrogenase-associated putative ABC transporter substrate-binding protein [Gemmatimonadaceae bacterium]
MLALAAAQPAAAQASSGNAAAATTSKRAKPTLRLCEDPNNLPFSSTETVGLEHKIGELLARDLGTTVEDVWQPQRIGFVRNTMGAGRCDLIVNVPAHYDPVATTKPYYRTTYVFVYRTDRGYHITSLDDPVLKHMKIGVQLVGADNENPPGAEALARRGLMKNVVGFSVYGDSATGYMGGPNPAADIVHAVARGDVDVAIVWGPTAGYFAPREGVPLTLVPVTPSVDTLSGKRFVYDMAMGVPKADTGAVTLLNGLIERERPAIEKLLREYGVPLVRGDKTALTTAEQDKH